MRIRSLGTWKAASTMVLRQIAAQYKGEIVQSPGCQSHGNEGQGDRGWG